MAYIKYKPQLSYPCVGCVAQCHVVEPVFRKDRHEACDIGPDTADVCTAQRDTCHHNSDSSLLYLSHLPVGLPQILSWVSSTKRKKMSGSGSNLESRSLLDELRSFDKGGFFDLGHPLLNRIAESFVKAAGIGAIQAVSREAYFTAVESVNGDATTGSTETGAPKRHNRFPDLRGESNHKSVEALVKNTGIESLQWGLAAGMYSGITYGLKEARGVHDWKNSLMAGAATGAVLALTAGDHSHEQVVQCAITGAAISTAANLLTGIF